MPDHVVTRPRLADVLAAEATVEMDRLVQEALAEAARIEVKPRPADHRPGAERHGSRIGLEGP
jgi:hypothetical protein